MSDKSWKRARREARPFYQRLDAMAREQRHCPWWRLALLSLGFGGFARRWYATWERRHAARMARAWKAGAHKVVEAKR